MPTRSLRSDTDAFKERERLQALEALQVFATPPEAAFDDLAWLAAALCETPIALVSLIGKDTLWFKARHGIDAESVPRSEGFCGHAIAHDALLEVEDASLDPRFFRFPIVAGSAGIRFYAGMPLHGSDGYAYGTLCVLDTRPRKLGDIQREGLQRLARRTTDSLEARRKHLLAQGKKAAIAQLLDLLPDGVVTCDESGILQEFNAVARDWHGMDPRAYPASEWATHFGLYDDKGVHLLRSDQVPLARAWRGETVREQTIVIRPLNQPQRTVSCNAHPLLDEEGKIQGAVCSMHDITVQIRFAHMMEKMALTDELTGLPNRAAWFAELNRVVAHAQRSGCSIAVLFIDLDGFKQINDSLGHAAGDEVLYQFSSRLRDSCRKTDFVARLAGDEFVICLNHFDEEKTHPAAIAEQIHDAMRYPMDVGGHQLVVRCSVGVAVGKGPDIDADRIMDLADKAMYEAKRGQGRPDLAR